MDDSKQAIVIERHLVPPAKDKERLSDYAIGLFEAYPTRKSIKKAIKSGLVLVDGKKGQTGTWIHPGQTLELLEAPLPNMTPFDISINVLYEDEWLAVVEKPAGLATSGPYYRTLENSLSINLQPTKTPDALPHPRVAHRLDGPTNGLVLVAKTRSVRAYVGRQFESGAIEKHYKCLAMGQCPSAGVINIPLDGNSARTTFTRIEMVPSLKSEYLSHLALFPETGRTHQLRRHLAMIGHPILGDKLYGKPGRILKGKGLFLAASGLRFRHPVKGNTCSFSLKTPHKFQTRLNSEQRRWQKFQK